MIFSRHLGLDSCPRVSSAPSLSPKMSISRTAARQLLKAVAKAAPASQARAYSVLARKAPVVAAAASRSFAAVRGVKTLSFAGVEETVYEVRLLPFSLSSPPRFSALSIPLTPLALFFSSPPPARRLAPSQAPGLLQGSSTRLTSIYAEFARVLMC